MYKRYYTYIHPLHISIFERMGQQTYWTITQMHACTVLPLSNRIWIIHPSDTSIFPSRNKGTAITMTFKIITCPRNRVRTQNDRCGIIVSIIHDVDDTATIREPSREEESRREVWEVCFFGEYEREEREKSIDRRHRLLHESRRILGGE